MNDEEIGCIGVEVDFFSHSHFLCHGSFSQMLPAGADRYLKLILLELNPFVTLIFFAKAPFFGCYLLKLMNAGEVDSIGVEVGFF